MKILVKNWTVVWCGGVGSAEDGIKISHWVKYAHGKKRFKNQFHQKSENKLAVSK